MTRPVAIVQHEPSVPPGSIEEVIQSSGVEHYIFNAWQRDDWPSAEELGALIVMGGTMNVDEVDDYPFLVRARELMGDALERKVPTLGVCLGSQMMARVLGAEVHRTDPRNATFSPVVLTEEGRRDPVLIPFEDAVPVLQFHEDTFAVPERAVTLATSASSSTTQAFRYGSNAYAVQFHFEVDRDIIRAWTGEIGERSMAEDWGITEEDLMAQADRHLSAQEQSGKELVRGFLEVAGLT